MIFPLRQTKWIAFVLVTLGAFRVLAQSETVERVVATVNDKPVYLSELRAQALPFVEQQASQGGTTDAELKKIYSNVLENLIDDALIAQVADRSMIHVSTDDIDRAIASIREQNSMTEEQLKKTLAQQGVSETAYRKSIKQQLVRLKVLNQFVRQRVNISDDAVRREYERRAVAQGTTLRYRVSQILISVPAKASAIEDARARKQIQEIREQLLGKDAKAFTDRKDADELGWVSQSDLSSNVEKQLLETSVNSISQPTRTGAGYAIYFVHEKQTGSDFPTFEDMHDPIYSELTDQAMEKQTAQFLKEMRRSAQIRYSL